MKLCNVAITIKGVVFSDQFATSTRLREIIKIKNEVEEQFIDSIFPGPGEQLISIDVELSEPFEKLEGSK